MQMPQKNPPLIVGLGGTTRSSSSSECSLRAVLSRVEAFGFRTKLFAGPDLMLPIYEPGGATEAARELLAAIRDASGIVISSPCYHGSLSGLIKNALDYLEETSRDKAPYLDGRVVGLIASGYGHQGPAQVLCQMRAIVHALRGWPTPIGVAVNSAAVRFENGACSDSKITGQIELMSSQIAHFVNMDRKVSVLKKSA